VTPHPLSIHPLVYFAAPYTKGDPVENCHIAMEMWHEVQQEGIVVPVCPHWSMFQHFLHPLTYDEWIAYDMCIIRRCDALFRSPGVSEGADEEMTFAVSLNMPVFRDLRPLYKWPRMTYKGPAT